LSSQAFPKRVLGDERLQLRHNFAVYTELEIRLKPVLEGGQPELFKPLCLPAKRPRSEARQRRPAPKLQCLPE
jgi:hypothetical protein